MEENKVQAAGRISARQGGTARATSMLDNSLTPRNFGGAAAGSNTSRPIVQSRMSQQLNNVSSQSMMMPMTNTRRSLNSNRLLDQPTLPQTFDVREVREQHADNCMLCEAAFTRKIKLLQRNPQKNCKRCGRAICETCSD